MQVQLLEPCFRLPPRLSADIRHKHASRKSALRIVSLKYKTPEEGGKNTADVETDFPVGGNKSLGWRIIWQCERSNLSYLLVVNHSLPALMLLGWG